MYMYTAKRKISRRAHSCNEIMQITLLITRIAESRRKLEMQVNNVHDIIYQKRIQELKLQFHKSSFLIFSFRKYSSKFFSYFEKMILKCHNSIIYLESVIVTYWQTRIQVKPSIVRYICWSDYILLTTTRHVVHC